MADMLATGAAWLANQLASHVSQTVTYWRKSKSITPLKATLGRTEFSIEDQGTGIATQWESTDFLIKPGDLVLNGQTITPEVGDRIEWDGRKYEVLPPSGEPAKRRSGVYGYLIRIHTKLIDT